MAAATRWPELPCATLHGTTWTRPGSVCARHWRPNLKQLSALNLNIIVVAMRQL